MKKIYLFTMLFISGWLYGQTTFLVEHFDYNQGDEIRMHGWSAHSAGGTNPILVSAEGLSLATSNYAGNAVGNAAWVINNGSDENKMLSSFIPQPNDGDGPVNTYASFLMKPFGPIPEATGNIRPYFFHFGEYNDVDNPEPTDLSTAFRARTFILPGTIPNTFRMNLSFNENEPNPANVTGNYSADQTHLVVVKYTSIAGVDNDEVSLFIFRDGDDFSAEPSNPTIGPLTGTNRDVVIQAVALRQYQDNQNVIVDGIIVRDHWDMTGETTSVPEPLVAESPIAIYPNPASQGILFVESKLTDPIDVTIFDISGKVLANELNVTNYLTLHHLKAGMYLIHATQNGKTYYQKLIVK
jgi:hypothetical protein